MNHGFPDREDDKMKFNLKTFPLKVNQQGIDITLMTTPKLSKDDKKIIKIAEWKVGFEEELRKKLVYPTNTTSVEVYDFIKEILGDAK